MCKICTEYWNGVLTWEEAWQNTVEMSIEDPHHEDVVIMLINEQVEDD